MPQSAVVVTEFRIGAVLQDSLRIPARLLLPFLLVALLFVWPVEMAFELAGLNDFFADLGTVFGRPMSPDQRAALFGISILDSVVGGLVVAALTTATLRHLRGRRERVVSTLWAMLPCLPTVVGVVLLQNLALVAGLAFIVVPGIIAMLMLWVAVPVAVAERCGVIDSLKRSTVLTRGHRWPILGLLMVGVAVFGTVTLIPGLLAEMLGATPGSLFDNIFAVLMDAVFAITFGVLTVVSYDHLRAVAEGGSPVDLAAVFD